MILTIQDLFQLGMDRHIPQLMQGVDGQVANIGRGEKIIQGAHNLDLPDWHFDMGLPFDDLSVGTIHAYHVLEHCQNPVELLLECQRVLKTGGVMNIVVPYYNSQMQAQDLDHKSKFCEMTWSTLFRNKYYNKNKIDWRLEVGVNLIIGIAERNLCLMTQLIKV